MRNAKVELGDYFSEMELTPQEESYRSCKKNNSKSMLMKALCSHAQKRPGTSAFRSRSQSVKPDRLGTVIKRNASLVMKRAEKNSEVNAVDNYFMQHSANAKCNRTSKRTLAKLQLADGSGLPDPDLFESTLSSYKSGYQDLIRKRRAEIAKDLFPRWPAYLRAGFNILLFGVGSKREVLTKFRNDYLANEDCIVIYGFQQNVGIRQILNKIVSDVLQLSDAPSSVSSQLELILNYYSRPVSSESPLYILLHSIDGRNFRTVKAQTILSRLASVSHVHLIASMDHINLPILWSQTELSRFCWLWEDCSTLSAYTAEAGFSNSRLLQQLLTGRSLALDTHLFSNNVDVVALTRLRHVMASLTENARDIYRLLVDYQIKAVDEGMQTRKLTTNGKKARELEEINVLGMPLEELYWRCRDAFFVTSEATLRAQLTEFKDHKLVKFSKSVDGTELLKIPLDITSLREILQNKEAFG